MQRSISIFGFSIPILELLLLKYFDISSFESMSRRRIGMGIASTKQALISKPHLTLNEPARKSACKHRELLYCARLADGDVSNRFTVGRATAFLDLLFYPALHSGV